MTVWLRGQYYTRSAKQSYAEAQYVLGLLHSHGSDDDDMAVAVEW